MGSGPRYAPYTYSERTPPAMMSPVFPASPAQERSDALPQYGFGPELSFDELVENNPFLFRIHTPKERSPFYDSSEPYFVGQRFAEDGTVPSGAPATWTYGDAAAHLDWTSRGSSPYVSASFSFGWALWEATRRFHHGFKHAIEIAVIDARAVAGRSVTAVHLLRQAAPKDRHEEHWKWYRFAMESQDVLVWGSIPGTAVLASIPLPHILAKLPSYFLSADPADPAAEASKPSPTSRLAWDYARKKGSYRRFCHDMSARFLRMPDDRRLRDASAGAVRLALALLRPAFHKLVTDDPIAAARPVCELAFVLAQWPAQAWIRDHCQIRDLIRCIVHILGEEAREARRLQVLTDAARMQEIVKRFESLAYAHQERALERVRLPSVPDEHLPSEERDECASPVADAPVLAPVSPAETTPVVPKATDSDAFDLSIDAWLRAASYLCTGFFFGSFVTLCMLAPDRRELANWLT